MVWKNLIIFLITIGVLFQAPHALAHGVYLNQKSGEMEANHHSCCKDKKEDHNHCKDKKNAKDCCDMVCTPTLVKVFLFTTETSIEKTYSNNVYLNVVKVNPTFSLQSYIVSNWVPPEFI